MRTSTPLAVTALAVCLTACGADNDAASAGASTTPPAPELSTPAPSASASPRPTGPFAKNGFDYQACKDASCEVYVRTGSKVPVRSSVAGFGTLEVTKVSSSGVDLAGRTSGTSVSASGQQAGFRARLNNLAIVTVTVNQHHPAGNGEETLAILRLSPA
jgi:hypothetical protein